MGLNFTHELEMSWIDRDLNGEFHESRWKNMAITDEISIFDFLITVFKHFLII